MDIKAYLTDYKGNRKEISNFIGNISISGSSKECARALDFDFLRGDFDNNLPDIKMNLGDTIEFLEVGEKETKSFFKGVIWEKDFKDNTANISVQGYDKSIYLNKNEPKTQVFTNKKPDDIVKSICKEFGLAVGKCATAKANSVNGRDANAYDIIMQAYTKASKSNGKKYKLVSNGDKIEVFESGEKCKTVLKYIDYVADGKILDLNYKESLDDVVNEIKAIDEEKEDKKETKKTKPTSKSKYGSMQKVVRGGKTDVAGLMKDMNKEISVECIGNWEMITGKSIEIKTPTISGTFYINSDDHEINDGIHKVSLKLSNEFEMDEKDESTQEEAKDEQKSSTGTKSGGSGWARISAAAYRHTGKPYSQPLRMQEGYADCSSFVYKVTMETLGKNWKGTWAPSTYTMASRTDLWHEIPLSQARPGDILWRSGHTSFLGPNNMDYGAHMPGKPSGPGWAYNPSRWSKAFRIN